MAKSKKSAKKAPKTKAKKKAKTRTRSNPPETATADEPPVDQDESPPEIPEDHEPEAPPPPPPLTFPMPDPEPAASMMSVADLTAALPEAALRELLQSDRAQAIMDSDHHEEEAKQAEIDELFDEVEGLDQKTRHNARYRVWRIKPLYHKGVRTEGLCETFHPPFSLDDVRRQFGGGTYEITLFLPGENQSQTRPANERRVATVPINGEPLVYSLSRDTEGKGVQLDPKFTAGIDALKKQVEDLTEKLADKAQPAESFADGILKDLAPVLLERFMNPPAPVAPEPPPPPPTFMEQLENVQALSEFVQTLTPATPAAPGATADDDDSALADIRKNMEHATEIGKLAMNMFEATGIKKTKPAAGVTDEEKTRQDNESMGMLATFIDTTWVYLMSDNTADETAALLHKFITDNVPSMYVTFFKNNLTTDYVANFLEQRAGNDPNRLKRLQSDRGKAMIASVLQKLLAKMDAA